jgi:A/G-specific adenine glycosylase
MLQRTRANQVAETYSIFIRKFPKASTLATSNTLELRKLLKPLGLAYRQTRFKKIARFLVREYSGKVPESRENLLELTGVGIYIANAVMCFAFNRDIVLVDVNILRILKRVFSWNLSKDAHKKKGIWYFVQSLAPHSNTKIFNWAMIDIGRTVCKEKKPNCKICPLKNICDFALRSGLGKA